MSNFFGQNVNFLLKQKGITQVEAATALDLKRSTLANYTSGHTQPNFETLERFVLFLGVDANNLLFADLENVQGIDFSDKKNSLENVQENVQGDVQVNGKKDAEQDQPDLVARNNDEIYLVQAKYIGILEKYNRVLEGKVIEHDFLNRFEDVSATVKALQELVLRGDLGNMTSYAEKWAAFRKTKSAVLVESGIAVGDST